MDAKAHTQDGIGFEEGPDGQAVRVLVVPFPFDQIDQPGAGDWTDERVAEEVRRAQAQAVLRVLQTICQGSPDEAGRRAWLLAFNSQIWPEKTQSQLARELGVSQSAISRQCIKISEEKPVFVEESAPSAVPSA